MNNNLKEFGEYLKAARNSKGLTLRAVEEATEISNAYLSQLESGRVKQPSPVVLHKLSEIYEISYSELLQLVGYPVPGQMDRSGQSNFAARIGPTSPEEEEALIEYLEFLRSKHKRGNK